MTRRVLAGLCVGAVVCLPVAIPTVQRVGSMVAWGYLATGAGEGGGPHVRAFNLGDNSPGTFDAATDEVASFFAYGAAFPGGARVAMRCFGFGTAAVGGKGDVLLVTGAGPGGGPHVRVFDVSRGLPRTRNEVASFFPYAASFSGGVSVAIGEFDNNSSTREIVTGAGAGGGPHVRIFTVTAAGVVTPFAGFFAYAPAFPGGVWVAAGDIDNDGTDEVITGPGEGGGPHVRVLDVSTSGTVTAFADFFAYAAAFSGGVFVAAGDVDNDGFAEVVTGAGRGGGPHVRVFDVAASGATAKTGFFAYGAAFPGGVRVAVGDLDSSNPPGIVTGAGPGGGPHVRSFTVSGSTVSPGAVSFFPFGAGFSGGVFVGADQSC